MEIFTGHRDCDCKSHCCKRAISIISNCSYLLGSCNSKQACLCPGLVGLTNSSDMSCPEGTKLSVGLVTSVTTSGEVGPVCTLGGLLEEQIQFATYKQIYKVHTVVQTKMPKTHIQKLKKNIYSR